MELIRRLAEDDKDGVMAHKVRIVFASPSYDVSQYFNMFGHPGYLLNFNDRY